MRQGQERGAQYKTGSQRYVRRADKVLVVDVEETCWPKGEKPEGQESEIIQVGVAVLLSAGDGAPRIVDETRSWYAKPVRSRVSQFCTKLTGITQERLDREGLALAEVYGHVAGMSANEFAWASYGDFDRRAFIRNARQSSLEYPFGERHLNVKFLAAAANGWAEEVGMPVALQRMGLSLEGTHHDAAWDAFNVARLLAALLRRR